MFFPYTSGGILLFVFWIFPLAIERWGRPYVRTRIHFYIDVSSIRPRACGWE